MCEKFNGGVIFKFSMTRSLLTRIKDKLPSTMNSSVVYRIPCSCGKVCIGETRWRLESRIKEHKDVCMKENLGSLVI